MKKKHTPKRSRRVREEYPGATEDARKLAEREAAFTKAGATPLPGPLREAFAGQPRVVCGFTLRPVVASDIIFLQQLDSPVLRAVRLLAEIQLLPEKKRQAEFVRRANERLPGETPSAYRARMSVEAIETFFIFTQPVERIRELLRAGRPAFSREAAKLTDKLPVTGLGEIAEAIGEHFASGFITALGYQAKKETGKDGGFPLPPAEAKTASAGG